MTDNEIIKALECCINDKCQECPLNKLFCGREVATEYALDLINRQKAEIERLKKRLVLAEECIDEIEDAAYRAGSNDRIDEVIEEYNTLVKEMVGDNNV